MSRLRLNRRQGGFTILELMIAIAVAGVITALALPSFTSFIQNNRLSGEANELVAAFQLARSEALKRADPVTVCASANGEGCGGNWNQGWIVLANAGADDEEIVRVWPSPGGDFQFTPAGGLVVFQRTGFANAAFSVDLDLDRCTTNSARRVTIERSGRVGSERVECS